MHHSSLCSRALPYTKSIAKKVLICLDGMLSEEFISLQRGVLKSKLLTLVGMSLSYFSPMISYQIPTRFHDRKNLNIFFNWFTSDNNLIGRCSQSKAHPLAPTLGITLHWLFGSRFVGVCFHLPICPLFLC